MARYGFWQMRYTRYLVLVRPTKRRSYFRFIFFTHADHRYSCGGVSEDLEYGIYPLHEHMQRHFRSLLIAGQTKCARHDCGCADWKACRR